MPPNWSRPASATKTRLTDQQDAWMNSFSRPAERPWILAVAAGRSQEEVCLLDRPCTPITRSIPWTRHDSRRSCFPKRRIHGFRRWPRAADRRLIRTASGSRIPTASGFATPSSRPSLDRFYVDPTLVAYGEENRDWGGAFAVYRGLTEALPYHRLFNSPISEGAIVGSAVGYALEGGRALVELMYCDFMGRAGDELFNQLSKWQSMSGGLLKMPVVVRVSVGSKYGAQHSQDWTIAVRPTSPA